MATTSQQVVNSAFLQALGRPADPSGLEFYTGQLEAGRSVGDILADLNYAAATGVEDKAANQAITASGGWDFAPPPPPSGGGGGGGSAAAPAAQVTPLTAQDLYNQFLSGRPALEKDIKFWNNYIAQYGPDQAMAAFDAAAQEERNMDLAARAASLREQNLVREGAITAQDLYNEYLGGRSALPADLDFWNNYITVYGPDKARAAFQESAKPEKEMPVEERVKSLRDQNLTVPGSLMGEFATQRKATPAEVRSMYLSVLGREPDPEGFSYYTSQPIESLRQNFYQGSIPEMEKRVAAIPVTTTIPKPVIGQVSPQSRGQSVDIPGSFVTTNQGAPKPLTVDISTMPREQQDLTSFIVGKMPRPTTTSPGPMFTPGEVNAQLELERLKAMNAPSTTDQGPVAGFAQGGLVGNDINRLLQNQRNAVMRESQSRQMLTNLGAPPVKKFSDGGPAGSSSGVRRLKMSGYQEGGEVTDDAFIQEMMTGTRPEDETTSPGILPPELREAIDVPLDFANLLIRGTAAVPIGGAAGLYKGITGGKYGTQEGVKEADTEAARMMAKITGEPKTQAAKDVLEFIGGKAQEYKLDAALPQLLTLPSPGPGAAAALMRSYELAETPPVGAVKLADKGAKPVATPPTDALGFYSPTEQVVMNLSQDKGTASQMLAQITKAPGVKPVELRATGLDEFLKGKGNEPVTKQEIQDFLTSNRVEVDEVKLGRGQVLSPEAKQRMAEAENRMMEIDNDLGDYFTSLPFFPTDLFYRLRGPVARKAVAGDAEAMTELDEMELPPNIKQLALEFGEQKNEYLKYSKQAKRMEKPKFDGYNIPGGQNAREIYLTLPLKKSTEAEARSVVGDETWNRMTPEQRQEFMSYPTEAVKQNQFTAPSAHAVSPEADKNRLAHIFLDDRTDAEGKKVLFVQELQSDWAQQGRDKGFAKTYTPDQLKAEEVLPKPPGPPVWRVTYPDGNQSTFAANTADEAIASAIQREGNIGAPPSAPFVTNTEDWLNLALKRVIKEAVDSGADNVAFIKGEQAADKYSLRTFVDEIKADRAFNTNNEMYVAITPKNSISPHLFYVGEDGIIKEPISADVRSKFLGKPLSEIVGKEVAKKLMSTKAGEVQTLSDEGLSIGGEGMKGFYDNILPKTAEKLLKRLGGGKVEPVEVVKGAPSQMPFEANAFLDWMEQNHPGTKRSDAARAWGMGMDNNQFVKEFYEETKGDKYLGFKITPEMREMVKTQGLPKFAAGGEVTDFIKRAA